MDIVEAGGACKRTFTAQGIKADDVETFFGVQSTLLADEIRGKPRLIVVYFRH